MEESTPRLKLFIVGAGRFTSFIGRGHSTPTIYRGALYPVFPITCRFSPFYDWESLNPSQMLQFDFLWTPSSFLKTSPLESNNTAFWATKIQNFALNHKDEHIIGLFFHLYHTNHSLGKWRSRNLHFLNKKWGLQPKNFVISSETTWAKRLWGRFSIYTTQITPLENVDYKTWT